MDFELSEENRMLKELVHRFVKDELMPLEASVLKREAEGGGLGIGEKETERLDAMSKSLGLWGLDAPEDVEVGFAELARLRHRRSSGTCGGGHPLADRGLPATSVAGTVRNGR